MGELADALKEDREHIEEISSGVGKTVNLDALIYRTHELTVFRTLGTEEMLTLHFVACAMVATQAEKAAWYGRTLNALGQIEHYRPSLRELIHHHTSAKERAEALHGQFVRFYMQVDLELGPEPKRNEQYKTIKKIFRKYSSTNPQERMEREDSYT
ncbi:hypothetical protein HYU11_04310 [Candidatus Woesearchaeota archaeon]|nr:hypothetical protein [Candidatus Woesearchaeota archaeon]